jgi:hypothetical protein
VDGDGDGYLDLDDFAKLSSNEADFLDGQYYNIHNKDSKKYVTVGFDSWEYPYMADKWNDDMFDFVFKWDTIKDANGLEISGYKIESAKYDGQVLTLGKNMFGDYDLKYIQDTDDIKQLWIVVPNDYNTYTFKSAFNCTNKESSYYLAFADYEEDIDKQIYISNYYNNGLNISGLCKDWVTYGEAYAGKAYAENHNIPITNYEYNKEIYPQLVNSYIANSNCYNYEGCFNGQHKDEFNKMMLSNSYMSDVVCEVLASYNALILSDEEIDFCKLAFEFEANALISPNGNLGSNPKKIANCLKAYNVDFEEKTSNFPVPICFKQNSKLNSLQKSLEEGKIIIFSGWNYVDGKSIDVSNGIHTIALKYDNVAKNIKAYNLNCNIYEEVKSFKTVSEMFEFTNNKNNKNPEFSTFIWAYILNS